MDIQSFELERYFAKYEFKAPYLLSCSDCEPLSLQGLLSMADKKSKRMWEELSLGYTESQGHPILREEVTKLYSNAEKDDILILAPEEGIFVAMNCILKEGDHVVATFPGYQSLYEIANSIGCELSKWNPREGENWTFDIKDLKKSIKGNTKLIVINFPHNPTGATIEQEKLREIIKISQKNDIIIFSDEMYRLLEYEKSDRLPSTFTLSENAVSLFGMSKSFALAGLRIGWLATKNSDLIDKFISFKDYTTICNSAPSEILATIALRSKERILSRNLEIIHTNLKKLEDFFRNYKELFKWHEPRAGSIAFPELTIDTEISNFCNDLIEEEGVMLVPSEVMDYKGNNFRVGFGREDMPRALERLKEYLKENYSHLT